VSTEPGEPCPTPFETSPCVDKLLPALIAAQAVFKPAVKGAENPHFQRRYADLSDVWESCREPLHEHRFAVLYPLRPNGDGVDVSVVLWHESGQWVKSCLTLKADLKRPQEIGSGITYFRRYLLASLLAISTQDDDAEAATRRQEGRRDRGRPHERRDQPRNGSVPAEGKVPPRDDGPPAAMDAASATKIARRFESTVNAFCQRMNAAWVERHTSEDGEIPAWVKDLANPYQVTNHTLKKGGVELPKGASVADRMKAASRIWYADEAGTLAEWKRYVKGLAEDQDHRHAGDDGEGELARAASEGREPGCDDE
jgi:hypothetical protein